MACETKNTCDSRSSLVGCRHSEIIEIYPLDYAKSLKYLRAMAELGAGPHRSGDIAHLLKKEVQAVAPTRATLISKGMIYSPPHGDNSFTVPLFDGYMKRVMNDWR